MAKLVTIFASIILIIYPVLIYLGMSLFSTKSLALILLILVALRVAIIAKIKKDQLKKLLPLAISMGAVSLFSLITNNQTALLLIPFIANITLLLTFGLSLFRPPNMVERFAALKEKIITPAISSYCFKVTIIWCIFFIFNGLISLYTVFFTSKEYWTLYNGLISYILIGLLMGVELITRKAVQKKTIKNE